MIVNQGYFFAVPVLSVNISSAGILINSNENTKQAFPWQVEKVEKSLLELSFTAIEDLLEYLESDETTFAKYIASEPYKSQQRFFIKTALEFSRHFDIANSRYLYSTIAYIMKRVEDQELELAFNAPFVEFMRENESDPKIKHLLTRFINPGIALITAAKALRERIIVTRNGIATINLSGNYNAIKKNFPQDKQETDTAYDQLMESGLKYFQDGLAYILENANDYPDFTENVSNRKRYNLVNSQEKGIWMN